MGDEMVLTITDDGVGGHRPGCTSATAAGGSGREIIAGIVARLGGAATILAADGGGTMVRVTMPLRASRSGPPGSAHSRRSPGDDGTGRRRTMKAWRGRAGLKDLATSLSGFLYGRGRREGGGGAPRMLVRGTVPSADRSQACRPAG